MRVLIIKTSSMGDVIHTLPALTDAMRAIPDIKFDWVVEEKFQAIPKWHPAVDRVIPIQLRQWKKNKNYRLKNIFYALKKFHATLNQTSYDLVLDAQGLMKSALITSFVRAPSAGYNKKSIREKWASIFYKKKYNISRNQHAVERIRQLFSEALYYPRPKTMADYGINKAIWLDNTVEPYVLFFHGTTWINKHWPENYWKVLIELLNKQQLKIKLAWGTQEEYERSLRLSQHVNAEVLPDLNIATLVPVIANASAVVAVDTGLCHLASALNIPTIALFGPTDPEKTGLMGEKQINLTANFPCAPCLKRECHYKGEEISNAQKISNNCLSPLSAWPACFTTLPPQLVMDKLLTIWGNK
ncbi:MAG: lipopolysaccharide heptosyltransferase I [Pseudomonadota bacterium]